MKKPSLVLYNITAVIVALVVLQAWILPHRLQVGYEPKSKESWSDLTMDDPRIGSTPVKGSWLSGHDGSVAVVFIDDCGECNLGRVEEFDRLSVPEGTSRVVAVLGRQSVDDVRKARERYPSIVFTETTKDWEEAWNVTFRPRVYALDRNGRLVFIQSPDQSFVAALPSAVRSLR